MAETRLSTADELYVDIVEEDHDMSFRVHALKELTLTVLDAIIVDPSFEIFMFHGVSMEAVNPCEISCFNA